MTVALYFNTYFNNDSIVTGPRPALAGTGPNARPRRGAPLRSGVIKSSCSVNHVMTFLMKIF